MLLMLLTLLMLLVADTAGLKHLAVLDAVDHFESPCSFEDMDRMSAIKMIAVAERFQRFNLCPGNDVKVRLERRKVDRLERRKVDRLEHRNVTPTEG